MADYAARKKEPVQKADNYMSKYAGYRLTLDWINMDWANIEPYDLKNEMLEVRLTTRGGQDYVANFTTQKFIDDIFRKNKKTGECLSGTYFCMPDNMVIVDELTNDNIKKTIDDLIDKKEIECYFKIFD